MATASYMMVGDNIDNIKTKGIYTYNGYAEYSGTKPFSNGWGSLIVTGWPNQILQYLIDYTNPGLYVRSKSDTSDWSAWRYNPLALKSDLPTIEHVSCTYFNETSLRGNISKNSMDVFVAPLSYNDVGIKVKEVVRTGNTIVLLGDAFVTTDSMDISVMIF